MKLLSVTPIEPKGDLIATYEISGQQKDFGNIFIAELAIRISNLGNHPTFNIHSLDFGTPEFQHCASLMDKLAEYFEVLAVGLRKDLAEPNIQLIV